MISFNFESIAQKKSKAPAIAEALLPPYEKYTHCKSSKFSESATTFIVKKNFKSYKMKIITSVVTFGTHIDMPIAL